MARLGTPNYRSSKFMNETKSFLCFDFGLKRFGVATGNSITRTASPLPPFSAQDGIPDWNHIEQLIKEWKPNEIIVGLPLNMDGTESDLSMRARKFGKRVHGRYHLPVHMMDERLSSFEAKSMQRSNSKKAIDFGEHSVDGQAACLILESWFSSLE